MNCTWVVVIETREDAENPSLIDSVVGPFEDHDEANQWIDDDKQEPANVRFRYTVVPFLPA